MLSLVFLSCALEFIGAVSGFGAHMHLVQRTIANLPVSGNGASPVGLGEVALEILVISSVCCLFSVNFGELPHWKWRF